MVSENCPYMGPIILTILQYKLTDWTCTSLEARFQPLTSNSLSTNSSKYIPNHETFPGMRMYKS